MKEFIINLIFNKEDMRVRGSFIQVAKLLFVYASYIAFILLVWKQVLTGKETLSSLTAFIVSLLGIISAEQSINYKAYSAQKQVEAAQNNIVDKQ